MKRHAATAIPGGLTSGKVEREKEPKLSAPSTSAETNTPSPKQSPLPPSVEQTKDIALKEAKEAKEATTAVAVGEGKSPIEPKAVGEAKPAAATAGQDAKAAVKQKGVSGVAPEVAGTDSSNSAAREAVEPVVAVEGKAATSAETKKKRDGVRPETTAAEKVLLFFVRALPPIVAPVRVVMPRENNILVNPSAKDDFLQFAVSFTIALFHPSHPIRC